MLDQIQKIMHDRTVIYKEAMTMSVYCHAHPLTSLRGDILKKWNVSPSRDLRRLPTGSTVRVSGMLIIVHTPPTKSGKRVMFLTMEDEWGLIDVVVFPKVQNRFAKLILTSDILTLEGKLQRQGKRGVSISVVMEKALIGLSGSMAKLLGNGMKETIQKLQGNRKAHRLNKTGAKSDGGESSAQDDPVNLQLPLEAEFDQAI